MKRGSALSTAGQLWLGADPVGQRNELFAITNRLPRSLVGVKSHRLVLNDAIDAKLGKRASHLSVPFLVPDDRSAIAESIAIARQEVCLEAQLDQSIVKAYHLVALGLIVPCLDLQLRSHALTSATAFQEQLNLVLEGVSPSARSFRLLAFALPLSHLQLVRRQAIISVRTDLVGLTVASDSAHDLAKDTSLDDVDPAG